LIPLISFLALHLQLFYPAHACSLATGPCTCSFLLWKCSGLKSSHSLFLHFFLVFANVFIKILPYKI
jgi:hypothetical protein